jgi:hypothetical protein
MKEKANEFDQRQESSKKTLKVGRKIDSSKTEFVIVKKKAV